MLEAETGGSAAKVARRKGPQWAAAAWGWFAGDPRLGFAIAILCLMVFLALFAPIIAPFDPERPDVGPRLAAPSGEHIFGTDINGMDVFSRVIFAPRVDLFIPAVSVTLSLVAGSLLGLFGGYFSGRGGVAGVTAELLARVVDIVQSFPVFIIALALVGVAGASTRNVIIILSILFAPIFFRYVRGDVLSVRERLFMEAAIAMGNPRSRLMMRHALPNSITTALVQASPTMGFAILLTAGLSFVGAGVRPPTPEWGAMISVGSQQMVSGQWWSSFFPGVAIGLTVFSLAIVGESLRMRLEG